MLRILSKIILLNIFLYIETVAAVPSCINSKIRYINSSRYKTERSTLCFIKEQAVNKKYFVSRNCVNKNCKVLNNFDKSIYIKDLFFPLGAPGHKLCRKLSGTPQIIQYWFKGQWIDSERCIFDNKTFVQIGLLYLRFKSSVVHQ
ncbi:MAG: hypothetical protein ISR65_01560 [Bacteriovoracaceae bacterium]|nr:hypothetical protein [Bacteriovoracaceae bacterium]